MNLPIILINLCFVWVQSHHIIFENIGQLASAVTYLHATIVINFTTIEDQYMLYLGMLHNINVKLHGIGTDSPWYNLTEIHHTERKRINAMWEEDLNKSKQTIMFHILRSNWVVKDIDALRAAMPTPLPTDSFTILDQPEREPVSDGENNGFSYKPATETLFKNVANKVVDKLYIVGQQYMERTRLPRLASLAMGAVGTFLGLYNTLRINQLGRDFSQLRDSHNQLVEIIDDQQANIYRMNVSMQSLLNYIQLSRQMNPTTLSQNCQQVEQDIYRQSQKVTHAVQAAQYHRLSVDLLTAVQLKKLFKKLSGLAKKLNNQLLIQRPSDLFQLEVSYFSDGQDVYLLLHVPSVPKEGLMDLFQLHPFPLPIDANFSLIPIVENNVLALTPDYRKYHTQLSTTNLMDCLKVNQVYVCERHGVLMKQLNQTCVGALYLQDYEAAQVMCQIKVTPTQEIVFQLLSNWFLIFSPVTFTSDVHCANGTRSRFFIPTGVSKHHLSAGCHADFKQHVLFSNNAVRLDSDILHFEWQWEEQFFKNNDPQMLIDSLKELEASNTGAPTISDLNHIKIKNKSGFNYLFQIIGFILSTVATAIITLVILFLMIKYRVQVVRSYNICCKPCNKNDVITPVGQEDIPLKEIEPLPLYSSSYRSANQLYPSSP
jgi:hypothetical protein